MRSGPRLLMLPALLLAACGAGPASAPTGTPIPSATVPAHAAEIRFGLIGGPRPVNVWELFDAGGAGYADYALRNEYWPRLYTLAPPAWTFEPLAAQGPPSGLIEEGGFFSAEVKLRTDLEWTDGTAFTAEDVAFTVNTALAFELGFDWGAYYPPEYLSRAEAVDPSTVRFLFKKKPGTPAWAYGVLQGPVVQRAFWGQAAAGAASRLPDEALRARVEQARAYRDGIQGTVDRLTDQVTALRVGGGTDRKLEASLTASRNELIFAQNSLDKLLEQAEAGLTAARQALYALEDAGEPTLGTWIPAGRRGQAWVNEANPARPFLSPNFDRAVYETYDAPEQAVEALRNDEIDLILWPGGSGPAIPSNAEAILSSPSGAAGYLAFNPADPALADPALRQAVACLLEIPQRSLSGTRADFVLPLNSFWHNPEARRACMDLDEDGARQEQAVRILKEAGYSWETGPDGGAPASGLLMPDGNPLPGLTLIAAADPAEAPDFLDPQGIARSLQPIGVTLQVETGSPQDLRYRVFSSRAYDLAILDWRLGLYPGYLCGWFGAGGSFDSGSEALHAACAALESEPDLQAARRRVFEIQSLLAEELPFIPLYVEMRTDAIRNIAYPFDSLVGGLGGVYGAPSFAVPAP